MASNTLQEATRNGPRPEQHERNENDELAPTEASQDNDISETPTEMIEEVSPIISTPQEPASMENRLRPAADIINRIIWDPAFDSENYIIGYEDRFAGRLEASVCSWKKDLTDEEFIPQHRVLYIKCRSDGEIVWDRRRRIDKIFNSGNSAFSSLAFLS